MGEREDREKVERLHDFLDGERAGEAPEGAGAIREMESWLRSSRAAAPAGFAERLAERMATDDANRPAPPTAAPRRPRRAARWWAAAASVAAAALLILSLRSENGVVAPVATTPSPAESLVSHEFLFPAGDAGRVCLVGSFNEWTVCETPLRPVGDGWWKVTVALPPGRHEYMFVVDDQWETDPTAPFHVDDGFGNQNAVVLLGT